MTIVGFNFDSLSVEKTALPKGQISIKNDIKIKGVEKEDFPLEKGKKKCFVFYSSFQQNTSLKSVF